jgi:hypothetical protein
MLGGYWEGELMPFFGAAIRGSCKALSLSVSSRAKQHALRTEPTLTLVERRPLSAPPLRPLRRRCQV